jgi:4-amino-4-deoxy-L-arabinose transferase-like glycosyltransferase
LQPSTLAKRGCLFLFLAIMACYFYRLGRLPFVGADEPRYAEVAREMYLRRDLITPTLGGHPWFEKPALLYWLIIGSFSLFGISEWAARLGPAICGLLTIAAVYVLGTRVETASSGGEQRGLGSTSALVTASTAGILVFSRGVSFDIVVTMTITWALSCFLISELEENQERRRLLLATFYVFVGLSLLAKGLVGIVVPLGVVGIYHLLRRELPVRRLLFSLVWGIPLALAVSAMWYVPVIARHGWPFIHQFFIQHHFARYLTDKYHHSQPFYYYLLIVIPMSVPWTAVLIAGVVEAKTWQWQATDPRSKLRVFALAWVLVPLVFFSFSGSKLPGYILPVLPAVALIAGDCLTRFKSGERMGTWAMRVTGMLLILLALSGVVYARRTGNFSLRCMIFVAAPLIAAGVCSLIWRRIGTAFVVLITCATLSSSVILLNCDLTKIAQRESARDLIQLANSQGYSSARLYGLHTTDRTTEFYAAGRLAYGPDGEPVKFEGAAQVAEVARQSQQPILIIVPVEHLHQLTEFKTLQTEVIGDNGRISLVAVYGRGN